MICTWTSLVLLCSLDISSNFLCFLSTANRYLTPHCSAQPAQDQPPKNNPFALWIASAPPGIQRLIELGQVSLEIDDQELAARKKLGLTKFRFDYEYRYRFNHTEIPPKSKNDPASVAVSATIQLSEVKLSHRILVGSNFLPEQPWKSQLMLHEFDHVSISTDPRLRTLLRLVLGAPIKFQLPSRTPEGQAAEAISKRIDDQISLVMRERVREIERVTQALNDRFDRESNNGAQTIAQREVFFADFYKPQTLVEQEFKYPEILDEYSKLIAKAKWKEHYTLNPYP